MGDQGKKKKDFDRKEFSSRKSLRNDFVKTTVERSVPNNTEVNLSENKTTEKLEN